MPIDRVDQLPLPNLQWYAGFSGLGLFYAIVYALTAPEGLFTTLSSDVWCMAVSMPGTGGGNVTTNCINTDYVPCDISVH